MQKTKFCTILLVLAMLAAIFSLSPAISSLMNSVVIGSTGRIGTGYYVTANSGHWSDIQAAIDLAETTGADTVFIPEGNWNFVNVDESWTGTRVLVDMSDFPNGINIFGAPTERTSGQTPPARGLNPNDQVVEWKTILTMPWDMPSGDVNCWFGFEGDGDPKKPVRFSDIKMVGYRTFDNSSTNYHVGVSMRGVINFRIDHCFLHNVCHGLTTRGKPSYPVISGVIDHCKLINDLGIPAPYNERTVDYGVNAWVTGSMSWESDISKILGKNLDYTVFIEDCYFSKWRHCIAGNLGIHYVWRYNTIQYDFGQGSIDAHGVSTGPIGTRAIEIYKNEIIDRDSNWVPIYGYSRAIQFRGGGGVVWDNHEDGTYDQFVYLTSEGSPPYTPNDIWIWGNEVGATLVATDGTVQAGEEYHLNEPTTFTYTPYTYPHPLTL